MIFEWQPYNEIPKFLSASDICILPARRNDIMMNIVPIKMTEYMAIAKPVISTELSGMIREFGNGSDVIFTKNTKTVLDCALELINQKGKLSELGSKAKEYVEKNDWKTITNEFEEIFREVINRG